MNAHPINLALRFLLEIAALLSVSLWGWQIGEGWTRTILALGIPILVAFLWATFRVPNDPGAAPVAIPGYLRLTFELALFGLAVWALFDMEHVILAWSLGVVVGIQTIFSYDRILWIIKQ